MEMLNFVLAHVYEGQDGDGRRKIDLALLGRLGENGGEIVEDDDLPASMQGLEAPTWWNSEHDPFADQHDLGSSDASFHGNR